MKLGFDSEREDACVGALLVYQTYHSRDRARFKVSLDQWSRIERAVKASAKRADSLGAFVERLKPRLSCESLRPLYTAAGEGVPRDFQGLTSLIDQPPAPPFTVLRTLYRETSLCVLLVRERLERERTLKDADKAGAKATADDHEDDSDDASSDINEIF